MPKPGGVSRVKVLLRRLLGDDIAAYVQALRIVYLLKRRTFMEPEIGWVQDRIERGAVLIDVGACGGNWIYPFSAQLGEGGHIYAFEPHGFCARATRHALRLLGVRNATMLSIGLAEVDSTGALRLVGDDGEPLLSGHQYIDTSTTQDSKRAQSVELRALDSLANTLPRLREAAVIKCDVEGFELSVMRGGEGVLATARPIVILEVGEYGKHGYSEADVSRFFASHNYRPFALLPDGRLGLTDEDLEHPDVAPGGNRIFLPAETADRYAGAGEQ